MSRTERLLNDLERGFEALEAGDLDAAAAILERCQRVDRKNADVVTLAAAVADASGEIDEALTNYRLLAELRPDDPMPRICAARLELAVGDVDSALETVESAFAFIDDEDDLIEAVYVKAQAQILRGDAEAAKETLGELNTSMIEDGDLALDFSELAMSIDDTAGALKWIEIAAKDPGLVADCAHAIGRVHEITGDRAKMIAAWQQARKLDLSGPPPATELTVDEVEKAAAAALAELPQKVRDKLANVPILIDDVPSEELVADGVDPRLLGLFQGTPMPDDGELAGTVNNIHLFRTNLARACEDKDELLDEIRVTVLHETAHYFGLDEDDLEKMGLD